MRLPRFRFTIRRLMLAVVIMALLLGGLVGAERAIRLRRTYCRKHAAYCARMMERTMPSSSSTPEERAVPHEEECLLRGAEGRIRIRR